MPGGEPDDLAEELLVDLAEDFRGKDGKLVGALGIVEPAQNILEHLVVNLQTRREVVGRFGSILFGVEVKEAGVVSVVGLFVEIAKPPIDVLAVEERLKLGVGFDATVFANAEEDDPVDGALDGKVQLVDGECGIAHRQVLGERFAPRFDLFQELSIDRGRATLAIGDGILVEGAFEDCLLGKDGGDLVPFGQVVPIGQVQNASGAGFISRVRACPAIVDGELFEIRQDGQRKFGRPGIAAKLIGRTEIVFQIDGGFLGFEEKLARAADTKTIVGSFGVAADLDGIFMDDIFIRLGVALLIGDIPPERLEERIEKLPTHLGFVVALALVGFAVLLEAVDEGGNDRRRLTHNRQSLFVSVSVPPKNTPFH